MSVYNYNHIRKLLALFCKYNDAHTLEMSNSKNINKTALSNRKMTEKVVEEHLGEFQVMAML